MKEDNAEIATMEQQIAEIQDHINRLQEEQSQLDQVIWKVFHNQINVTSTSIRSVFSTLFNAVKMQKKTTT